MTNEQYQDLVAELRLKQDGVIKDKGHDYTQGSTDRLANFKEVAKLTGQKPLDVWAVYFMKHVLAIMTYVQTEKLSSEPIEGRFLDASNYINLGLAIIKEDHDPNHMFPGQTWTIKSKDQSKLSEASPPKSSDNRIEIPKPLPRSYL